MDTRGLALAVIRVIVGGWFLKAAVTKLTLDYLWWIPYPTVTQRFIGFLPKRVAEFASENPVLWYRQFLLDTVIPNSTLFAFLESFGEVGVGIGVTLGLVTSFSALVGLLMSINFFLATQWMSFGQQGFHLVLAGCFLGFLIGRAGRAWGLDALIVKRWPNRWVQWLL
ncbi:MAG TPA: TQO small subunit DoxD [Alphaproteobacteria bacterium]|nr:TQO small subunit DoxD [Alphaproteobacteria bacterium]